MDSKLQIISGEFRGRRLILPPFARPTQNMARGAIFNMLATIIPAGNKIIVWDAFAGSGALGVEALSRYANSTAIFTDTSDTSIKTITKNTTDIAANRIRIVKADALKEIKKHAVGVDLIFVDPPYEDARVGIDFVAKLAEQARAGTVVVQEIESNVSYTPDETKWDVLRDKKYGRARFLILHRRGK